MSVRYSPKSHISLPKYENNYPYHGLKTAWKSLNDVQWETVDVNPMDPRGEIIKLLFFFGILLLLGPGLIIINVGEIINQGDDFSAWGSEYGPEDPEFAGEVIWEGTTDAVSYTHLTLPTSH